MPRSEPIPPVVPGAIVRPTDQGSFRDRWVVDYGAITIEFDGDFYEPINPGHRYRVVRSRASRHAPFGQTTRPNSRTGPVLHRVRQVDFAWYGFDYSRSHPRMRVEWWCRNTSHSAMLLHPAQVVGRLVCAKCEAYAVAFGEEASGLGLRRPREFPRDEDR